MATTLKGYIGSAVLGACLLGVPIGTYLTTESLSYGTHQTSGSSNLQRDEKPMHSTFQTFNSHSMLDYIKHPLFGASLIFFSGFGALIYLNKSEAEAEKREREGLEARTLPEEGVIGSS